MPTARFGVPTRLMSPVPYALWPVLELTFALLIACRELFDGQRRRDRSPACNSRLAPLSTADGTADVVPVRGYDIRRELGLVPLFSCIRRRVARLWCEVQHPSMPAQEMCYTCCVVQCCIWMLIQRAHPPSLDASPKVCLGIVCFSTTQTVLTCIHEFAGKITGSSPTRSQRTISRR